MALIKCKLCGKQITDTVKKCPHCGFLNDRYRNVRLEAIKKKKGFIIAMSIVSLCIVTFLTVAGIEIYAYTRDIKIAANTFTENEKVAADAIKSLKSSISSGDEISVDEIWYRKTNLSKQQVLINYRNNKKANSTVICLVEEGIIKGDDTKADRTVSKYATKKEKEQVALAQEIRDLWNTKGSAYQMFVKLDKDKILRNL